MAVDTDQISTLLSRYAHHEEAHCSLEPPCPSTRQIVGLAHRWRTGQFARVRHVQIQKTSGLWLAALQGAICQLQLKPCC